ncbi:hypothetical protein jhhlp_000760 [Lomentospora prolificans]|uniref:CFEM domain-containing protein n=1 Tax=Lomentospora prolificans TaxID=41688 RepID=A0A2N3NJM9_9PEZI|nr:hypothetical protein jhhlp_000760 [Lomentospora prolificans]
MKFSTVLLSLASVASIAYADPVDENGDGLPDGDIPGCASSCFLSTYLSNLPAMMACTEANLFLCFCKSSYIPLLYKNCVCNSCSASEKQAALQFGLDTCSINGAPITWVGDTC